MGQWRELVEKNDWEFDWLTLQFQVGSWAGYQSDKSGKWNPVAALEVESAKSCFLQQQETQFSQQLTTSRKDISSASPIRPLPRQGHTLDRPTTNET